MTRLLRIQLSDIEGNVAIDALNKSIGVQKEKAENASSIAAAALDDSVEGRKVIGAGDGGNGGDSEIVRRNQQHNRRD